MSNLVSSSTLKSSPTVKSSDTSALPVISSVLNCDVGSPLPCILNEPLVDTEPVISEDPDIIIDPINVWTSVVSSPKKFDPDENICDEVTNEEVNSVVVIFDTVNLSLVASYAKPASVWRIPPAPVYTTLPAVLPAVTWEADIKFCPCHEPEILVGDKLAKFCDCHDPETVAAERLEYEEVIWFEDEIVPDGKFSVTWEADMKFCPCHDPETVADVRLEYEAVIWFEEEIVPDGKFSVTWEPDMKFCPCHEPEIPAGVNGCAAVP